MYRKQEAVDGTEGEVLRFIADYIGKNRWAPSYREILDATNLSSTSTVRSYILRLEADGYIIFGNGPRKIVVTDDGWKKAGMRT